MFLKLSLEIDPRHVLGHGMGRMTTYLGQSDSFIV